MGAPRTEQIEPAALFTTAGRTSRGLRIGCGDDGTGKPMVLLHCSGADRRHWDRMIQAWPACGGPPRRFLMPELFGCGQTARWPGAAGITLRDYVALIAASLPPLDEPFDLVGHSFGGAVALAVARTMPGRVRTLTLIEPAAFFALRDAGPYEAKLFDQIARLGRAMQTGAARAEPEARHNAMALFVDYWNGSGKWQALPPAARTAIAEMTEVVALEFTAAFAETARLADCRDITLPTLLISGERSPEPARHIVRRLATAMPRARHVCIAEAAHMMPLSHAPALALLLRETTAAAGSDLEL